MRIERITDKKVTEVH